MEKMWLPFDLKTILSFNVLSILNTVYSQHEFKFLIVLYCNQ